MLLPVFKSLTDMRRLATGQHYKLQKEKFKIQAVHFCTFWATTTLYIYKQVSFCEFVLKLVGVYDEHLIASVSLKKRSRNR